MISLIITVIAAAIFGYFATQNTMAVPVHFAGYSVAGVPLYVVMVGSLLVGLLVAGLISLINGVGTAFSIHGRDARVKQLERELATLRKEHEQLKTTHVTTREENKEIKDEVLAEKHPLIHSVKHTVS